MDAVAATVPEAGMIAAACTDCRAPLSIAAGRRRSDRPWPLAPDPNRRAPWR